LLITAGIAGLFLLIAQARLLPARQNEARAEWIAYLSFQDSRWDVYRIEAGGSEPVPLTQDNLIETRLIWSPDGRWLAFEANQANSPTSRLYRLRPTGHHREALTPEECTFGRDSLTWSPDSQWLIFWANCPELGSGTFRLSMATGEWQRLPVLDVAYVPRYSPDGRWVAFRRYVPNNKATPAYHLYRMQPDGSQQHQIDAVSADNISWSPDGQWLLFGTGNDIYKIRPDGSELQNISITRGVESSAEWSPDGRWIAFTSTQSTSWGDIYRMRPDGSDLQLLTHNTLTDWQPTWSPVIDLALDEERLLGFGGVLLLIGATGLLFRQLADRFIGLPGRRH
jgi:TolB protein